ncbi:hypothetical protein SERLA73DRAFT_59278 [Serpula lacrymans var. lacrymans S7.3]|uniref:DNA repair protein REV1 n=2 Tax=Serpula lacrymans var. lacrymans TaxID=341189 RepID=F8Q6R1_SERL3|nr:uncharacterized protein SERLADRAFT_372476 [Serpula lacrymans var. lacrymans S7.9]EGN96299.1 hypothetical protein SERLA73DRAFT_59278 [Serpula lacrymans var. lacrymans S7.3]EGO21833.1 hypothetical protein SERLADRAFT_372476 [Serpula lacrymans var. lacrymans S7.9]
MEDKAKSVGPTGSLSSDLFEPDDPEFAEFLQTTVLPGDEQAERPSKLDNDDSSSGERGLTLSKPSLKRRHSETEQPIPSNPVQLAQSVEQPVTLKNADIYGAARFGHFGEYMRRKRAKLQIQNADMDVSENDDSERRTIFKGLAIYINGWTEPSVQDLRQLIIKHGGIYHPYLDKKSLVTHIITCSLTPAKIREFKNMKVVRPEWLVESAASGSLLPWKNYIFRPGDRLQESQGTRTTQQSLFTISESRPHAITGHPNNQTPQEAPQSEVNPFNDSPTTHPATKTFDSRPLYMTDPGTYEEAARIPGYAAHTSNLMAERVMANPEWRAAHTSIAPDFIEGFYKNSRLHHLSTWKAELKNLVLEAQIRAENGAMVTPSESSHTKNPQVSRKLQDDPIPEPEDGVSMKGAELTIRTSPKGKGKAKALQIERVIMHCDFDCFFVSAGLVSRPQLRGKPVAVCHSQGSQGGAASTSEIASASYEARSFGVKNGMSLQQARKLCPTIVTIPYEFEKYRQFSLQFYTVLMRYADDLQAVSVDEALLDVTSAVSDVKNQVSRLPVSEAITRDPAKELAEKIRDEIRKATECEVSIGIAENILLARLATRRAKPAASFHLVPEKVHEFLAPLDVDDLHGFGHSTRQKTQEKLGVTTLGELAKKSKAVLCDALGKGTGETLYKAIRGIDERRLESDKPRKSVSCDINYGIRFENGEQAKTFIYQMAQEVSRRLNSIYMLGRSLTLKIMKRDPNAPVEAPKFMGHGVCETFSKQMALSGPNGRPTSATTVIGDHAWKLLESFDFDPKELRGIGIQIQKLEMSSNSGSTEPGQAKLPFKPVPESPSKVQASSSRRDSINNPIPPVIVNPPSQDKKLLDGLPKKAAKPFVPDLPSFSQVDKGVFDALPEDVRKELEVEYKRRSHSPMPAQTSSVFPIRSKSSEPISDYNNRITVKGTNVKRITQQLAPRNRASLSPRKNMLFTKRDGPSALQVSEAELEKLEIDPEVFFVLPIDMQREQLLMARHSRARGASVSGDHKVIKLPDRFPSTPQRKKPIPKAVHPHVPFLKQQGKQKGEKLYFTETDDVQRVIEVWVEGFRERALNRRDVDYFSKFLVESAESGDTGMEKAAAVMKWWLTLLRRYWEIWEHNNNGSSEDKKFTGKPTSEIIGRTWWKAFREVKGKVDAVARKRFGGSIAIK